MTLHETLLACEREYLRAMLLKHDFNMSAVAREAGVNRTSLYEKLRRKKLYTPSLWRQRIATVRAST